MSKYPKDDRRHMILKVGPGIGPKNFSRSNYMGPGTDVVGRLRRGIKPKQINFKGKKVESYADKESQAHDIRYRLASSMPPEQGKKYMRQADTKFIQVMRRGIKQDKDYKLNLRAGKIGISGKVSLENLGLIPSTAFLKFNQPLNDSDRKLLESKLKELERQGFGNVGEWFRIINELRKIKLKSKEAMMRKDRYIKKMLKHPIAGIKKADIERANRYLQKQKNLS